MIIVIKEHIIQDHIRTAGPPVYNPIKKSPVSDEITATAVKQKAKFIKALNPL